MARARNKDDLLKFATENYSKLMGIISKMTENQMNTLFDFSGDNSKKEAHWNRDKNVRDILIHLYEWHQLMLKFIENNADGKSNIPFLPPEYSWKTYGAMNVMFWNRHQNTSLESAKAMLEESHEKVLALADKYSNEELFTKKYFSWTGTTDLGSYFVSTTSSHYDWAIKKIKLHCKKIV
ncbi:MAG: ClbS/DfsB family four-helix bundle protein [Treponema sp.]